MFNKPLNAIIHYIKTNIIKTQYQSVAIILKIYEKQVKSLAAIIQVRGLRKIYKIGTEKVRAIDGIDLDIQRGEFCCLVGASGSGKSTFLNQLAGLEKPTRGSVVIDGQDISKMSEKQLAIFRQQSLGFVFQSYNLMATMTAVENVALPLMFKGMSKIQRETVAKQQLRQMGLGKRMYHKPTEMSGGQQQRVGIARAFVSKPKVIFADEPTGNLDSKTTEEVMTAIIGLVRKYNITLVMVTHERELSMYADRIITLCDGVVISDEYQLSAERLAYQPDQADENEDALPSETAYDDYRIDDSDVADLLAQIQNV